MLVGLSSPKPNCLYNEYGSRFTLAPKSSSALSMQVPPMLTEIVGDPGSLYLTGVLLWIMELTCSVRKAFFLMSNPYSTVHRSEKYFELQFSFNGHKTSSVSLIHSWRVKEEELLNPGSGLCCSLHAWSILVDFLLTG